jgi:predicted DNA-binding transcriptional regulator AlpA
MPLPKLLSFKELKDKGVVNNRTQLHRLIKYRNFPNGFLLSANARRWTEEEVADWVEARRRKSRGENRRAQLSPPTTISSSDLAPLTGSTV